MQHDASVVVTTMVDYYGLPGNGDPARAWPGRAAAGSLPFALKAAHVQQAVAADIGAAMGGSWNAQRFIPFVMMHEFESLLFSDCVRFASGIGRSDLYVSLQQIRDAFSSPEEINDSPLTHPSQRIVDLMPGYQKPLFGILAALEIGFDSIRSACPHFEQWVRQLESLV
jgi:hypothetical protein